MAKFNKAFLDFSLGEISPNNLHKIVSDESNKAVSYLENAYINSEKNITRRVGTLKVGKTKYPVDPDNVGSRLVPMFIGRGNSFIGVMYVVDTTGWDMAMQQELESDAGVPYRAIDKKVLVIDWYRSEGDGDTYLSTSALYLDNTMSHIQFFEEVFPKTLSNEWTNLYGFGFRSFQTYTVVTHESGSVEPFVLFYGQNPVTQDYYLSWFKHRTGLSVTNPDYWPSQETSSAFSVPFEEANVNPNVALKISRLNTTDIIVTSQYYDKENSVFADWSTVSNLDDPPRKPHPLAKRTSFLRVTILNNSYILKYNGTETSPGVFEFLDDLTTHDAHRFKLIIDGDDNDGLWTVISTPVTTTDFNIESFNYTDGFPDNSIFYDQRLVFVRDGRFFNSNVGNAFLFNQYRFPQDDLVAAEIYYPVSSSTLEFRYLPLLIDYSATKIASDPFDFTPLTDALVDNAWVNKSDNLEYGTYSEVNNISGLEDTMYSFNSIKSSLGTNEGTKQSISIKAKSDTIFVGGDNRSLRNYYYDGRTRRYHSNDLNSLNPDIVKHLMDDAVNEEDIEILEISYDADIGSIDVIVGPHQRMISCNYDRDSEVAAWSRVTLGHDIDSGNVDIHSTAFVRNDKSLSAKYISTLRDGEVWLERLAYKYNKEEMNSFAVFGGGVQPHYLPCYLDFASRFVGSISGSFNIGMDYAGKSVEAFGDGFWIGTLPVDSLGNITLDRNVRTLVVGYKYATDIIFLECEPSSGGPAGGQIHALKSYEYVHLRLKSSYGGMITNTSYGHFEKIPYSNDDMIVGHSLKLFTGSVDIHLNQRSSVSNKVRIFTDAPYPFEIVGVLFTGEVNER